MAEFDFTKPGDPRVPQPAADTTPKHAFQWQSLIAEGETPLLTSEPWEGHEGQYETVIRVRLNPAMQQPTGTSPEERVAELQAMQQAKARLEANINNVAEEAQKYFETMREIESEIAQRKQKDPPETPYYIHTRMVQTVNPQRPQDPELILEMRGQPLIGIVTTWDSLGLPPYQIDPQLRPGSNVNRPSAQPPTPGTEHDAPER